MSWKTYQIFIFCTVIVVIALHNSLLPEIPEWLMLKLKFLLFGSCIFCIISIYYLVNCQSWTCSHNIIRIILFEPLTRWDSFLFCSIWIFQLKSSSLLLLLLFLNAKTFYLYKMRWCVRKTGSASLKNSIQ